MSDIIGVLSSVLATGYDLGRQIGDRGMASVYLAGAIRHECSVAIRVQRPELAAGLGSDRFVRAIKVTANLQHPNSRVRIAQADGDRLQTVWVSDRLLCAASSTEPPASASAS